jgi:hypothetical protein
VKKFTTPYTAINFRARASRLFLFPHFSFLSKIHSNLAPLFLVLEFIKHTRDDDSDDDAPPLSSLLLLSLRRTRYNDDIRDPRRRSRVAKRKTFFGTVVGKSGFAPSIGGMRGVSSRRRATARAIAPED